MNLKESVPDNMAELLDQHISGAVAARTRLVCQMVADGRAPGREWAIAEALEVVDRKMVYRCWPVRLQRKEGA